jgi:hypothetical protein
MISELYPQEFPNLTIMLPPRSCLRAPLTRDHLSVCGTWTPEGRRLQRAPEPPCSGADTVPFLRHGLTPCPACGC